jgi:hypothetical protein
MQITYSLAIIFFSEAQKEVILLHKRIFKRIFAK